MNIHSICENVIIKPQQNDNIESAKGSKTA